MLRYFGYTIALLIVSPLSSGFLVSPQASNTKNHATSSLIIVNKAGKGFGDKKNAPPMKKYYPLSKQEVEQWMGHIPVYAVTDPKGNGRAIQLQDASSENNKAVFYFFLSPIMAEAFLKQLLPTNGREEELTVSGLFLGKIWYEFDLLQEHDDQADEHVEYRLVPDPRDLMTAQTLLEIAKGDTQASSITQHKIAVKPYNAIPLFGVKMPLNNKRGQKVNDFLNQMVSSHYLFFSSRNMVDVMDGMEKEEGDQQENEDDLIFLHQVMAEMTSSTTTTTDYRNAVLVSPTPILDGIVSDAVLTEQLENAESFVCQTFLLPLLKE
jgi:hypothetical protein